MTSDVGLANKTVTCGTLQIAHITFKRQLFGSVEVSSIQLCGILKNATIACTI